MFSGARELRRRAEISRSCLGQTAGEADLAPGGFSLVSMSEHAMTLRRAAPISLAFFGVRRAPEIAVLRVADARVDRAGGSADVKARCQKNDQFGVGQVARVVALTSWGGACPVRLVAEWLWFRARLAPYCDCAGRLAAPGEDSPLFVGLARARFGLGLAASGLSASWKKGFGGRNLSPARAAPGST